MKGRPSCGLPGRAGAASSCEAGLETFAGADHGGARRIKAGIRHRAAARVVQPLQTLQEEIESYRDLQDGENVKGGFHVFRA